MSDVIPAPALPLAGPISGAENILFIQGGKLVQGPIATAFVGSNIDPVAVTAYTLQPSDKGRTKLFTSATDVTVIADVGLGADFLCSWIQGGAGQISVVGGDGVTLVNAFSQFSTLQQYVRLTLEALEADTLMLEGLTA